MVHGGSRFIEPTLDDEVVAAIEELRPLAPLHNEPALKAIREAREALPTGPTWRCSTRPSTRRSRTLRPYAIPRKWREDWGIRRYGFHGLAVGTVVAQLDAQRIVVCHLGGGCSVTAVLDGRSVDTTMGFSPLEGVPMATRSGSVDPGALIHLLEERGVSIERLDRELERESGLVALGGLDDPLGFSVYHVPDRGGRGAGGDGPRRARRTRVLGRRRGEPARRARRGGRPAALPWASSASSRCLLAKSAVIAEAVQLLG